MDVIVSAEPFDPGAEAATLMELGEIGAVVSFVGLVRSEPTNPLQALELDCYVELAVAQITDIIEQARSRFGIKAARVIHRFGVLRPGEPIVLVVTAGLHRREAFDAAEFIMDFLKTDAPFWKKEIRADGAQWLEAKQSDDSARERWGAV